jgi:hypothetical protein
LFVALSPPVTISLVGIVNCSLYLSSVQDIPEIHV